MPYRRSSYMRQGTRPGVKRFRRRAGGLKTRIKYQRPTARVQKSQLATLARIALKNQQMLRNSVTYTDWFDRVSTSVTGSAWAAYALMDPVSWDPGLRQDADVLVSQSCFVRNMVFEYNINCAEKNQASQWDMFIVTIRPSATEWQPVATPSGDLLAGVDFAEMGLTNAPQLNSGKFKVLWHKHMRIWPRKNASDVLTYSGNPYSTRKEGKVNLKLNVKIRAPSALSWKSQSINNLPARQRVYFFYRQSSEDTSNVTNIAFGTHMTVVAQS